MSNGKTKRLGILTGGGDCPGLNAVIRAAAKSAMNEGGFEVIGIEDGFEGLVEGRMRHLRSAAACQQYEKTEQRQIERFVFGNHVQ